jgi:signal transduction histidine kinase
MEALARAATVFASELNNVLTIVSTYQGFVADGQLSVSQARDLKVARDAVERGAALVDQLLAVNRWGEGALQVFDLNDLARGVEDLLRRLVGGKVSLLLVGAPSRLAVHAGAGQVEQLLINLALNARDAMPMGGVLSVNLRNAAVGPGHPLLGQLKGTSIWWSPIR